MRRLVSTRLALIVGAVGLLAASAVIISSRSPAEPTPPQTTEQLLAARQELDRTVWASEVEAQRYEARFISLWDALRASDDQLAVLASVPFAALTLGSVAERETLDLGITRVRFGRPDRELTPADWKRVLTRFGDDGYEVVQTEWHHGSFEPAYGDRPARSEVSVVIHAARDDPPHRVILNAEIDVRWSTRVDAQGIPIPDRVSVTALELLDRHAPPAFREVLTVESTPGRPRMQPLLVYDLDGDGLSEIVLAGRNWVIWNRGGGEFEAAQFLPEEHVFFSGGVLADFTGDGHVDFVAVDATRYALLFTGDADGRFTTSGRRIAELQFEQPRSFTAGDIDADGDLDLFIASYKPAYEGGQMPTPYYDANDGYPAYLLRNDGGGTFSDVTEAAGLGPKRTRRTYSSSLVDLDDDRDLDLIVVSDFAGLDMYLNDGRGRFTDVSEQFGQDRRLFGMSHTFADYDADGDLDLYVVGMSSTTARRLERMESAPDGKPVHNDLRAAMGYGNRMFLRRADRFAPAPFNDQVARTGWSWGASSVDFDNDGDKDIVVANGHVSGESSQDYCTVFWRHDIYTDDSDESTARENMFQFVMTPLQDADISWNGFEHNVLWMNEAGAGFTNVAFLFGVAFEYDGRAVVADDLDGDGRPDLLVVEFQSGGGSGNDAFVLHVYRNRLEEAGNWIGVRLRESGPGRSPIGATVTVRTPAGAQMTRVVTGDSFSAQHPTTVHFGLGNRTEIDAIEVLWPNGASRRIDHPDANQYVTVMPPTVSDGDRRPVGDAGLGVQSHP